MNERERKLFTVGIDPSSKKLAMVVMSNGRIIGTDRRVLPETSYGRRCQSAHMFITNFLLKWGMKADLDVYIEAPVMAARMNPQALIIQAKVHGAMAAAIMSSRYVKNLTELPPSVWKLAVMGKGYGNAPKDKIKGWVRSNWSRLALLAKNDQDITDAGMIARAGEMIRTGLYKYESTKSRNRRKAA